MVFMLKIVLFLVGFLFLMACFELEDGTCWLRCSADTFYKMLGIHNNTLFYKRKRKLQMNNESSSRPLGGVLVSVHHRIVYGSTAPWIVNHLARWPALRKQRHRIANCLVTLGCKASWWWKKERRKEPPFHPQTVPAIPPSLHYKTVEQIFFYKNSKNGSQKMVSKLIMHIWLADLIAQSFSTETSGQVCPGGSSWFTAFAFFNCPVFFKHS